MEALKLCVSVDDLFIRPIKKDVSNFKFRVEGPVITMMGYFSLAEVGH